MASKRRKKSRKKQEINSNVAPILAIFGITIVLIGVLGVMGMNQRVVLAAGNAQEQSLKEAIEAEKERSKNLDSVKESVNSEEFIKEAAKEMLGLVESDEIVFKAGD